MGKGLQDVGATLGGRVGALFAGVATQSILAWNLGADGRGALAVCLLFATLLVLVFSVGCDFGALYFVSSKRFSVSEGLFYTSIFGVICSVVAMLVGWGLLQTTISFFSKATNDAFLLSLLLIPTTLFSEVLRRLLTAVRLFKHFAGVTILRSVAQLLLTLCFVWWAGWGVQGAILAAILTAGFICIVCVVVFFRKFEIQLVKPSAKKFMAMFSYGVRYYIGKLSNMANMRVGAIILAFFATQAEIGWFAVASRLAKLVELVPEALTTALFPRMATDDKAGRKELVVRAARVVTVVCGVAFLVLAVFATPILCILFSPEFLPAVPLVRILAIGGTVHCFGKVLLSYLIATKHPGEASIVVTIGVVVNIALLWWLWPKIGLAAAAWAVTASYVVSSAILILVFRRVSGMRLREMFSFSRNDWRELVALVRKIQAKSAVWRKA